MKYLIVGLGNIGPEYHETRHNIGFMVADALAKEAGTAFKDGRYGFTTTLSIKGRQLILLKPSTFMNLSGNAVRYWMQKENIPLENVLIVVDDLALPFGTLRLKGKGSDAGHNGLKHIAATLGTQNYARLRFGIGNDFPRGGQVDFVLGHFTDEDWKTMDERLKMAGEIIKSFCLAASDEIIYSLAPKSVTTPIAMEVTKSLGGIPSLTAAVVVCVGLLGGILGFKTMKLTHIGSPMAQGLSLGAAAHAVGTSTAMDISRKYGAFASLGLTLNGIFTALLTPTILRLLGLL